ncbi:50S ribosomal protein L11 methyltransferase [Roseovarius nanhaiticus]|uniref:Ribosomal protein L11 methyltransferase n=1 Tax=Roseovarius nanhaiticus TaxID=573024 RepID=A0A1N7H602_9RHOB|nr:50S ribosomal protein L11 methyltransferase [Roseovarius nanhaiticus]SEL11777.1 [LSU ribosomal protein L11P]-lysine N-methyltransferase [Roseovarius nanhaiticus]SIS20221.1 [LSU ribosomal protein L11P]-lysine N-methyltransferase [Roseovarius nanhaiticus]
MPTYTALTTLTGQTSAEALADALDDLTPEPMGVGTFEIEDGSGTWEVGGYFEEAPDIAGLALLAQVHGARPFVISEVPETDWVAHVKRELTPVAAGRFFVYGSHDADKVPEDAEPLLIEAAMAFGTGHHGTTQGCLRALDRLAAQDAPHASIVDIGCGTAVLAMGAARVWPGTVLASDIDPVAVDVALVNVAANDLEGRVHCIVATGLDHPDLAAAAPFDLVFANILKGPLIDLAPAMTAAMAPGGHAILSGILNEQADEVLEVYLQVGNSLAHREVIGDWTTLTLQKIV